MNEKYVNFELISKTDSRIYVKGVVDINSIDDLDGGDWEYEQNDGTYSPRIPQYWTVDGVDKSYEFSQFIDTIDSDIFRQYIYDFQEKTTTIDLFDKILKINGDF